MTKKKLTHHEITDHITEETASALTQVCKESKLSIDGNIRGKVSYLFIHLS